MIFAGDASDHLLENPSTPDREITPTKTAYYYLAILKT